MKISAIEKISTPELVVRELLENIKNGDLKPGDKLPSERDLAGSFGVSRSSVREAVSAMVLVGYLEVTQGKGIFLRKDIPSPYILSSSLGEILDAYWTLDMIETRQIMECSIVKLAVQRCDKSDLIKLHEMIDKMDKSINDMEAFYKADFEFHRSICDMAKNPVMSEMVKIIISKTHDHYMKFMPDALCEPGQAVDTARSIVESIEKGRQDQACDYMVKHLNIVPDELRKLIPQVEDYKNKINTIFYSMPFNRNGTEQKP